MLLFCVLACVWLCFPLPCSAPLSFALRCVARLSWDNNDDQRPQLSAVLKEAAPGALAGLPSWATGKQSSSGDDNDDDGEGEGEEDEEVEDASSEGISAKETEAGLGPAGSLARELRQKVFELEEAVFSLEGKLRLADEARLERGDGRGDGDDGVASTAVVAVYDEAVASGRGELNTRRDDPLLCVYVCLCVLGLTAQHSASIYCCLSACASKHEHISVVFYQVQQYVFEINVFYISCYRWKNAMPSLTRG